MKDNSKGSVLIIATSFAPQNRIGAVRMSKLAKYLVRKGFKITIVTTDLADNDKIDLTLNSEELTEMDIHRVSRGIVFTKTLFRLRNKLLKEKSALSYVQSPKDTTFSMLKRYLFSNGMAFYNLVEMHAWERQVGELFKTKLYHKQFDAVISSYPKVSAHKAALKFIEHQKNCAWLADFRDPLTYESLNTARDYIKNKKIQYRFCKKANAITHVTVEMVDKLAEGILEKDKFFYLPNGFDNDDLKVIEKSNIKLSDNHNGVFKISYVGSLYGGKRDLSSLFGAIKRLCDLKRVELDKVKLFYAGKEYSTLVEQAQKYEVQDILVDIGYVTREDSLNLQNQSDLIVVNTWNTEKDIGVIPGKIYECFLLKKPTLAITNGTVPNSELGKMIMSAGLGFSYDTMVKDAAADERLSEFLLSLYEASIKKTETKLPLNKEYIEQFNYENIVSRLIEIIGQIKDK